MSLGDSLERLLEIWHYLKNYMDVIIEKKKSEDIKKIVRFYCLLNNNIFKLKIRLLEYVINQINRLHKKLQNQEFNIGCLKTEIKLCFESIFKLVCLPEKFETPFKEVIELDWEDASTQSQWFSKDQFLIQNLQNKVHKDFGYLKTIATDKKNFTPYVSYKQHTICN